MPCPSGHREGCMTKLVQTGCILRVTMIQGWFKKEYISKNGCKAWLFPELYFYGLITHGIQDLNQCAEHTHASFIKFEAYCFIWWQVWVRNAILNYNIVCVRQQNSFNTDLFCGGLLYGTVSRNSLWGKSCLNHPHGSNWRWRRGRYIERRKAKYV